MLFRSAGPHQKSFHLDPLWFAAQREADAVGLVIYRSKDIPTNTVTLQSSFVLPLAADSIRIGDRPIHFKKSEPAREAVRTGEVVLLRQGTAALALRIPWSRGLRETPAAVALIYDGNSLGAIRLTVEHGKPGAIDQTGTPNAGAAFWIRVGSGLSDEKSFSTWLEKFTRAQAKVDVQTDQVKLQIEGLAGPVGLETPSAKVANAQLTPAPVRVILEVDGTDLGSRILETR